MTFMIGYDGAGVRTRPRPADRQHRARDEAYDPDSLWKEVPEAPPSKS
jgi:hypothetical protein